MYMADYIISSGGATVTFTYVSGSQGCIIKGIQKLSRGYTAAFLAHFQVPELNRFYFRLLDISGVEYGKEK